MTSLERSEERIARLREVVRDLTHHINQKESFKAGNGGGPSRSVGLFETDEEAEKKRKDAREIGLTVCKLAAECAQRTQPSADETARLCEILGPEQARRFFGTYEDQSPRKEASEGIDRRTNEELEEELLKQVHMWLNHLSM